MSSNECLKPSEATDAARRLTALREAAHREHACRQQLAALTPDEAICLLGAWRARVREEPCRTAWLAFVGLAIGSGLGYHRERALYECAEARSEVCLRYGLLDIPPRLVHIQQRDPYPGLTLGERRWKARLSDPRVLERLRADPDPEVVAHLLVNPRTREQDVVLIASRRPAAAEALLQVARSPRWRALSAVQQALVQNPYTPPRVAVLLAPLLTLPALREVATDGVLHPAVREAALHLVVEGE
jgi:hypothetical protein